MDNRIKFYCWLIGKLENCRMTYEEIADGWARSSSNTSEETLSLRTFHRHREGIRRQFGLIVECDKSNGYNYYIRRDPVEYDNLTEWMLSALRIASLGEMLKYHSKAVIEPAPRNTGYLEEILNAIDKHYALRFHYCTPYGEESEMTLVPTFVRLFQQHWYVIGAKAETESVRTLAFDRISDLEVVCKPHKLSAKTARLLNPDTFFSDSFGITRIENIAPEKICIRAFYPQSHFLDEVPLHASQRKVAEGPDGAWCDYELYLRPTFDFIQKLLWHERKIAVLQPESLRQKMIKILKDMTESYETGRDMLEE